MSESAENDVPSGFVDGDPLADEILADTAEKAQVCPTLCDDTCMADCHSSEFHCDGCGSSTHDTVAHDPGPYPLTCGLCAKGIEHFPCVFGIGLVVLPPG